MPRKAEEPSTSDPVWFRVDAELSRRAAARMKPASWAELQERLECSKQTISMWKKRGVAATKHQAIADVFGWSMDHLLGRDEEVHDNGSEGALSLEELLQPATGDQLRALADQVRLAMVRARDRYPSERVMATLDLIDRLEARAADKGRPMP